MSWLFLGGEGEPCGDVLGMSRAPAWIPLPAIEPADLPGSIGELAGPDWQSNAGGDVGLGGSPNIGGYADGFQVFTLDGPVGGLLELAVGGVSVGIVYAVTGNLVINALGAGTAIDFVVSAGNPLRLTADGNCHLFGNAILYGQLWTAGAVAAIGPVGNVVGKVPWYDAIGTLLGWMPLYDTVT